MHLYVRVVREQERLGAGRAGPSCDQMGQGLRLCPCNGQHVTEEGMMVAEAASPCHRTHLPWSEELHQHDGILLDAGLEVFISELYDIRGPGGCEGGDQHEECSEDR